MVSRDAIRFHGGEGKYWGRYSDEALTGWAEWIVEQSRAGRPVPLSMYSRDDWYRTSAVF